MSENKKGGESNECIQVVVRCRPFNRKETDEKRKNIIAVDLEAKQIAIKNPANFEEAPKLFTYDATYDENTQQKLFYEESCFSIIESTLEGFNSTIFAYGQTGCGKSFTMQGPSTTNEDLRGVIPNSFEHIFQSVKTTKDVEFLIRCSYLELYNEEIKDLLCNPKSAVKCELKEDAQKGIFIKGLTDVVVENAEDLNRMLDKGLTNRTTAATNMNAESSRSHSIFTIVIEMSSKAEADGKEMLRVGKLNLVDLAGSERQKKTGAKGDTMKEGIKINISLSCLGNVISALSEGNTRHIPYRDSKLTRLLQDSLGGNTKTMMIAAISPADYNYDETMSTLRYANRAKNIKNKPKINEDPKDAVIREYKDEIEKLRRLLLEKDSLMNGMGAPPQLHQQQQSVNHNVSLAGSEANSHSSSFNEPQAPLQVSFPLDGFHQPAGPNSSEYEFDESPVISGEGAARKKTPKRQQQPIEEEDDGDSPSSLIQEQLREKEYEIEVERLKREEMAQRLQQLESLLVNNHESEAKKQSNSPAKPSKEAQEQEEEAAKKFKERKLRAKKKREAAQQAELQRVLEEKRSMEEELEELRQSAVGNSVPTTNRAYTPNNAEPEGGSSLEKKMARMKKRYEKRLAAAEDELSDMRDDFYYQRKQLMDALVEQEKDTRLYELICRSLLSDKDFKKTLDKCRYDEEADEWVVPFGAKKKNVDHLDSLPSSSSSAHAAQQLPKLGNNSLLPDINGRGGGTDRQQQDLMNTTMVLNTKQLSLASHGSLSARNGNTNQLIVPLLSLPGGTVTSSSMSPPASSQSNQYYGKNAAPVPNSGRQLPPSIHGSTGTSSVEYEKAFNVPAAKESGRDSAGGIGFEDKPKKNKGKTPKIPNSSAAIADNKQQQHQHNNVKMPSIGGGSANGKVAQPQAVQVLEDEAGTGENAGPIADWGFLNDDLALGADKRRHMDDSGSSGAGGYGPELEYSDDEDFEPAEQSKHKKSHGKKKKKKHSEGKEDHQYEKSPRQQFSLPKI